MEWLDIVARATALVFLVAALTICHYWMTDVLEDDKVFKDEESPPRF